MVEMPHTSSVYPYAKMLRQWAFHELIETQTHYAGRRGPQVQYFVCTRDVRKESRHSASAPLVKHTRDLLARGTVFHRYLIQVKL